MSADLLPGEMPGGSTVPDTGASLVTVNAEASLPFSRRLVAGTNVSLVDGGEGSTLTINATAGGGGTWGSITGTLSDQTDLNTALNGKAPTVHAHAIADVTGLQTSIDGKAAVVHVHAVSDTTGLQAALDGKSATGHGHAIADTTGLQTTLDGKQGLDADLTAIAAIATTGIASRTASNTWATRTLTGTANQVIIANGDGVSGNPTFSLPQDIHTGANPTFNNLTLSNASLTLTGVPVNRIPFFNASAAVTTNANFTYVAGTGLVVSDATASTSTSSGSITTPGGMSAAKLSYYHSIAINTSGQSYLISTRYGANSNGQNIWIGGGGQNSIGNVGDTTLGSYNTALGVNALLSATTAKWNSAFGTQALYSCTTGSGNVANGLYSLYLTTTAVDNTANGLYAMYYNTTGSYNVAIGREAMNNNKTGGSNVAVGRFALLSNIAGNQNVSLGAYNLFDATSTSGLITAISDYSGTVAGTVRVTATAHGRSTSDSLIISGTTTYDGTYTITVIDANSFYFTHAWGATSDGVWTLSGQLCQNNVAIGYNTGRGITHGSGNTILGAGLSGLSASLTNNIHLVSGGTSRLNFDGTNWVVPDAVNFSFNTTTGTKFGTSTTQKLAFYNSTPIAQRAGASQAAVSTTAATQTSPWGFSTQAQADAIITLLNEIRSALVALGLIKGSA